MDKIYYLLIIIAWIAVIYLHFNEPEDYDDE
jgi:hypothetical protein